MSKGMLGTLPLSEVRGPVNELCDRLAGDDGGQWLRGLKRFLRKESPWLKHKDFSTWKTLKLGIHKTYNEYHKALMKVGLPLKGFGYDISCRTHCSTRLIDIDLVRCTVAELGFKETASYKEITEVGTEEFGLKLCPAEVGLALRLAYNEQPKGDELLVAMEAIGLRYNRQVGYSVECSDTGEKLLTHYHAAMRDSYRPDTKFVFVRS